MLTSLLPDNFVGANVSALPVANLPGITDLSVEPARAYGLRAIIPTFTGALLRARRASDNTEADFKYVSDAAFWASGAAYVTTFYEQNGSGKHFVQATSASQLRLVGVDGVLETINGHPAVYFDGVDDFMISTGGHGAYAAGAMTVAGVVSGGAGPAACLLQEGNSATANSTYQMVSMVTGATLSQQIANDAGTAILAQESTNQDPDWLIAGGRQFTVIDTGSTWKKRVGGTALADRAYTRSGLFAATHLTLGAAKKNGAAGSYFNGRMSELAIWYSAVSNGDRDLIEANQTAYYGL